MGYATEFHPWSASKTAKSLHVVIYTRTILSNLNPKENYLERRPYTSDLVQIVKALAVGPAQAVMAPYKEYSANSNYSVSSDRRRTWWPSRILKELLKVMAGEFLR